MLVSTPALKSSTFVYYGMWYKNCRDEIWIVRITWALWGPCTGSKTVNLAQTSGTSDKRIIWA
ncbi:hypothetical protein HNQ64_001788 [Prosthecobacter dejongeii]|uniref:Uncharacterized protein n=1 Tax=Prosthecobacter dejongeii TaxID=48465 RepID=A0A7W7YK04_9BACT|nr:hypothetical protein [Prosthecobacter dejongeii]